MSGRNLRSDHALGPMLANAIVVPAYADPITWAIALVGALCEVSTVCRLLVRWGKHVDRVAQPLWAIQVSTWLPFLVAVDGGPRQRSGASPCSRPP